MSLGTVGNNLKVVLDSNIIVSALVYGGKPEQIYRLVLGRQINAYISPFIISELIEILAKKFHFNQIKLRQIERKIRKKFTVVNPIKILKIVRDADDNRIVETAIEGNCEYVITGDKDLLDLGNYKQIKIATADEFLSVLKG